MQSEDDNVKLSRKAATATLQEAQCDARVGKLALLSWAVWASDSERERDGKLIYDLKNVATAQYGK